jgi:site-specific DNA-methyltransferase (adenine-specific)
MDCLDGMKELEKQSIDLILTDPPFFIPAQHYQSRQQWQKKYSDLSVLKIFWNTLLEQYVRILKPTGHLVFFCNSDSYPVFYEPTYNLFHKCKCLVWDKGHVGLGHIFRNQHELIIWARFSESMFNDDKKLHSDILKFSATASDDREHPVEKPELLLQELISPLSPQDGIVLDPFCGSGTTLSAAQKINRKYIGFELDKGYFDGAQKRLADRKEQNIISRWFD